MKVLCIGQAAYDITFLMDKFPRENTKNKVSNMSECGGGTASNPAYLLGKWGVDVAFAGTVGNDIYGKKIIKEFVSANVDVSHLEVRNGEKTTMSFIVANQEKGSRTVFTYQSKEVLSSLSLDFEPDVILMDGSEYHASLEVIEKYPNAIKVLDAGRCVKEVIDLCYKVDYIVASKDFAEKASKIKIDVHDSTSLANMYNLLYMRFRKTLVITLEEKGCLYKDGNILKRMPTLAVSVVDSTGAGDFFHGAFVYGLIKKYPFEQILKLSNVTASLSLRYLGTRNSVPSKREVREIFHEFE